MRASICSRSRPAAWWSISPERYTTSTVPLCSSLHSAKFFTSLFFFPFSPQAGRVRAAAVVPEKQKNPLSRTVPGKVCRRGVSAGMVCPSPRIRDFI